MSLPTSGPLPVPAVADALSPRKRRRRPNASGAADDCFSCKDKNRICDRRRPYCSQCLEVGSDCSGYKTQLTWGVGVASRGKLRGLSLPIAKSSPVPRAPSRKVRPRSASTALVSDGGAQDDEIKTEPSDVGSVPVTPITQPLHVLASSRPSTATYPSSPVSYRTPEWTLPSTPMSQQWFQQRSLSHDQGLSYEHGKCTTSMVSSSLGSTHSYLDTDYTSSPLSRSYSKDEIPFRVQQSPLPLYSSYSSMGTHPDHSAVPVPMPDQPTSTSCPDSFYAPSDMASSLSSSYPQTPIYEMSREPCSQSQGFPNHGGTWFDDDGPCVPQRNELSLADLSTVKFPDRQHHSWSHFDHDAVDLQSPIGSAEVGGFTPSYRFSTVSDPVSRMSSLAQAPADLSQQSFFWG